MGAFLSGFKTKAEAEKKQVQKDGKLYSWEALLDYFATKP